jgi:hypothetical protein
MKLFKLFIMLYKSKLYISVLVLTICIGLIPIGFLVKEYVSDQVPTKIPDALLGIQEKVVPVVESDFLGLGIPETLKGIRTEAIPEIENDVVEVEAIPQTLLFIQNRTLQKLPLIINCSNTAQIIDETISNTTIISGSTSASIDLFFNNFSFKSDYNASIQGVSEYASGGSYSLNYPSSTGERLLNGYTYHNKDYPGILNDLELGTGVKDWIELYDQAENNTEDARSLIQTVYGCTWESGLLQNFSVYIKSYIWQDSVKKKYEPLSLQTYARSVFYSQWANGTLAPTGLFLDDIVEELDVELKAQVAAKELDGLINGIKPKADNNITLARDYFFNDYDFRDNFSVNIAGISEYASGGEYSLNFTLLAEYRILYGYEEYPGLFTEFQTGFGLLRWIELYTSAISNIEIRNTMMSIYNSTWSTQLDKVGKYIINYIYVEVIATEGVTGLEVGVPSASEINNSTTIELWDPTNINSIVNVTGIKKWYEAFNGNLTIQAELNALFNLDASQFNDLYNWLFKSFKEKIVPIFFTFLGYQGYRVTPEEYADDLYLVQWTNVTVYPRGLILEGGIKGFEAGIPIPLNISLATTRALFNPFNKYGFVNKIGLFKWIDAYHGDLTALAQLNTTFQIDNTQIGLITKWLFEEFRYSVVPNVVEHYSYDPKVKKSYTLTDLAVFAFQWQWANGTLFPEGIDPGAAIGVDSLAGWELGIPTPAYIRASTARILWNTESTLALVNKKGIGRWFRAADASSSYNSLKEVLDLNNTQMDATIAWLKMILDRFALPLMQYESGLSMNQYELADMYFVAITMTAGIISGISALAVIWVILSKQKNRDQQ